MADTPPPPRARPSLLAAMLIILATAGVARAQDEFEDEDEQPQQQQGVVVHQAQVGYTDEQFDQWVYNGRDVVAVRRRLESILALQIEDVDRTCGLTAAQKAKLDLAGRGDIKHMYDRIAEKKRKFQLVKHDQNKIGNIFQEIREFAAPLNSGPFDGESIYRKTIRKTLTPEQAAKYDAVLRDSMRFQYQARLEYVVAGLDEIVGLRAEQRKKLLALLMEETKPPRKFGSNDYLVVMLQAARMPEDRLRPIFDNLQWRVMTHQMTYARSMEPFLRTNGFLPEDFPAPAADDGNKQKAK